MDQFLLALQRVESSGLINPPDGDGGRSIGPFQITYGYWLDAVSTDTTLGGSHAECGRPEYAKRVVLAYLRHYAPEAIEKHRWEVLARTHNGGPSGPRNSRTLPYWRKVQKAMQRP